MKSEREPYGLIICLVPIILRINIEILVVKEIEGQYPACYEDISV
jgi:hypothetical protein